MYYFLQYIKKETQDMKNIFFRHERKKTKCNMTYFCPSQTDNKPNDIWRFNASLYKGKTGHYHAMRNVYYGTITNNIIVTINVTCY